MKKKNEIVQEKQRDIAKLKPGSVGAVHILKLLDDLPSVDKRITSLASMTRPHVWYPAARRMKRKIIFHAGPTNSGKTHRALQRFREARTGVYGGPLRLLAWEVFERTNEAGVPCELVTGQEREGPPTSSFDVDPDSIDRSQNVRHVSMTIEMLDLDRRYDVAVIDEVQMLGDFDRGWAWTRALLGVRAKEVHLCGDIAAETLVRKLAALAGDDLEVRTYDRLSPLMMDSSHVRKKARLRAGDCVVGFSRRDLYDLKEDIGKATGLNVGIIYGSLPPAVRREQARLFNDPANPKRTDILVATDAIGMGLNLNIARIVMSDIEKFDGKCTRRLTVSETKQIIGRAGRYGTRHQVGKVSSMEKSHMPFLKLAMETPSLELKRAGIQPTVEQLESFAEALAPIAAMFDGEAMGTPRRRGKKKQKWEEEEEAVEFHSPSPGASTHSKSYSQILLHGAASPSLDRVNNSTIEMARAFGRKWALEDDTDDSYYNVRGEDVLFKSASWDLVSTHDSKKGMGGACSDEDCDDGDYDGDYDEDKDQLYSRTSSRAVPMPPYDAYSTEPPFAPSLHRVHHKKHFHFDEYDDYFGYSSSDMDDDDMEIAYRYNYYRLLLQPLPFKSKVKRFGLEADSDPPTLADRVTGVVKPSTIIHLFLDLAFTDTSSFFLCGWKDALSIAKWLEDGGVKLPFRTLFTFLQAPVSTRDDLCRAALVGYAERYSLGMKVHHGVWFPKTLPKNEEELALRETFHAVLDLYIWLARHFPDEFPWLEEARDLSKMLEEHILDGLSRMGAKYTRDAGRKRALLERKKPDADEKGKTLEAGVVGSKIVGEEVEIELELTTVNV